VTSFTFLQVNRSRYTVIKGLLGSGIQDQIL